MKILQGIYLVLDGETTADLHMLMSTALANGIRLFQYRDKRGLNLELATSLHGLAREHNAVIFANDDIAGAKIMDGIHVGQEDLLTQPLAELRRALPQKLIGVSAHLPHHLFHALEADYLGIGPFAATSSKSVPRAPLGLEAIQELRRQSPLPVCAIGGIQVSDIPKLKAGGIAMVAVIGAIAHAADPAAACAAFVHAWKSSPCPK